MFYSTSLVTATKGTVYVTTLERDIACADRSTRAFYPLLFSTRPVWLTAIAASKDCFNLIITVNGDIRFGHCGCIAAAKDELDTCTVTAMNIDMRRLPCGWLVCRQVTATIDILDFVGAIFMSFTLVRCR